MFPVYEDGNSVEVGSYRRKSALSALKDDLGAYEDEGEDLTENIHVSESAQDEDEDDRVEDDESVAEEVFAESRLEEPKLAQPTIRNPEPAPRNERSNILLEYREIEELRQDLIKLENLRYSAMRELVKNHLNNSGAHTKNVDFETARYFVRMFDETSDVPRTAVSGSHTDYLSKLRDRVKTAALDLQKLKQKLKFARGEG